MLKRILYTTYSLDMGGLERVLLELANGLDPARFEPFICCVARGGALAEEFRLPRNLLVLDHHGRPSPKVLRRLTTWIGERDIDLVHTHNTNGLVFGYFPARRNRLPIVHTMHGHDRDYTQHRLLNLVEGWMSRRVDCYVSVSAAILSEMQQRYRLSQEHTRTLLNGIAVADRPPAAAPTTEQDDRYTFGTIGRLAPVKNYGLLLEAFAKLLQTHPHGRLELVGDGTEMATLRQTAERLGIEDRVHFHGAVHGVAPLIRNWDAFLLTSLSEGTSMSLLEAMAQARVCIASAVGGNPGVIEDGANGLLFPSRDREALTDKMEWVLTHRGQPTFEQMRHGAWETVRERFSAAAMIGQYSRIYEQLLGTRPQGGPACVG